MGEAIVTYAVGRLLSEITKAGASAAPSEASPDAEYRLPSWDKVTVDIKHIITGHTSGGGRGDGNKTLFSDGMTEAAILKAIEEAYKVAEKHGSIVYVWKDGVEQVKQFFQGAWNGGHIQFWFNYTTNTVESAWPKW
jgi:hypothetical protein